MCEYGQAIMLYLPLLRMTVSFISLFTAVQMTCGHIRLNHPSYPSMTVIRSGCGGCGVVIDG